MNDFQRHLPTIIAGLSIRAESTIPGAAGLIRFTTIDKGVLRQYRSDWENHPDRRVVWGWKDILGCATNDSKHIGLALYWGNKLCGLSHGYVERDADKEAVGVHVVEGSPDTRHPLKGSVLSCMIWMAEALAINLELYSVRRVAVRPNAALLGYHRGQGDQETILRKYLPAVSPRFLPFGVPVIGAQRPLNQTLSSVRPTDSNPYKLARPFQEP